MSLVIITDNMETEEIPTGESLARLYNIYDIGYQSAGGGNMARREVVFLFELDALKKDGKPYLISQRFTASMHPKANLRSFIEAWKGSPFADDEVREYDLEKLIGKCAFVNVVRRPAENGKKEWSEIFAIRSRGTVAPFITRLQPGFVPDWVTKAIAKQLPGHNDPGASNGSGPQNMPPRPAGSPGAGKYIPPNGTDEF
jgi:hypothetical protein